MRTLILVSVSSRDNSFFVEMSNPCVHFQVHAVRNRPRVVIGNREKEASMGRGESSHCFFGLNETRL